MALNLLLGSFAKTGDSMLNPLKQLVPPRIIKAGEAFECLHNLVPMRKGFQWQTFMAAGGYVKEIGKMQRLRTMKIFCHLDVRDLRSVLLSTSTTETHSIYANLSSVSRFPEVELENDLFCSLL